MPGPFRTARLGLPPRPPGLPGLKLRLASADASCGLPSILNALLISSMVSSFSDNVTRRPPCDRSGAPITSSWRATDTRRPAPTLLWGTSDPGDTCLSRLGWSSSAARLVRREPLSHVMVRCGALVRSIGSSSACPSLCTLVGMPFSRLTKGSSQHLSAATVPSTSDDVPSLMRPSAWCVCALRKRGRAAADASGLDAGEDGE
mmetsp:Transcript_87662/g.151885  ORF Transcript_87662/g.151885 Transcript_87662/m.151885 type:complete len:203 (-) Transcript_87662:306-914(-)